MFALQFCAHRNGGLTRGVKNLACPCSVRFVISRHKGVGVVPGFLLVSLILFPLLGSLVSLPARLRQRIAPVYTLVPILQLLIVVSLWTTVQEGNRLLLSWPWLPGLGLNLSLALDGLSWLFAGLISGVGVLVFAYAAAYMHDDPTLPRSQCRRGQ